MIYRELKWKCRGDKRQIYKENHFIPVDMCAVKILELTKETS